MLIRKKTYKLRKGETQHNKYMKTQRKILSLILICILILYCTLKITVNATENSSKILINSSKSNVQNNENFTVSISTNGANIAAYTLWIYYEKDKAECISQMDNISIKDNRIKYTWYSSDGKEKYTAPKNTHIVLVMGYDKENFYIIDPLKEGVTKVERSILEASYNAYGRQKFFMDFGRAGLFK